MPASPSLVSLDQVKTWARRLQKANPAIGKLSAAQETVALMLGHANWHALAKSYAQQPQSSTPAPAPVSLSDEDLKGRDLIAEDLALANELYPGLNATCVELLAIELDEMEVSPSELMGMARDRERETGMYFDDAIEEVMEEATVRVFPPPGKRFVRIINDKGQKVMTLLPMGFQARPAPTKKPPLGRFGHHPDPAIDFCVEVEGLMSMMVHKRLGLRQELPDETLARSVSRALEFQVGGDENAVSAKVALREAWDSFTTPSPSSQADEAGKPKASRKRRR